MRRALEKERYGYLQDVRSVMQAAGADAISPLLVFLHLLEREAERVAELLLTHAEHHPAHTYSTADVLVGRIGAFLCHVTSSLHHRFARMTFGQLRRARVGHRQIMR